MRKLDQAKRNYETSVLGVDLNRRRVEEQDMLAELGRGTAEAKVAAQNSLTSSMNQRTGALVNHTIARLSLWRDLGILDIKENGQWEEIFNVKTNNFSQFIMKQPSGNWGRWCCWRWRLTFFGRSVTHRNGTTFAARRGPLQITVLEAAASRRWKHRKSARKSRLPRHQDSEHCGRRLPGDGRRH